MTSVERRARRLMRWYPRSWRERHGDEFSALLEDSISDRPRWTRRSFNAVGHGLRLRAVALGHCVSVRPSTWVAALAVAALAFGGVALRTEQSAMGWSATMNFQVFMAPDASTAQLHDTAVAINESPQIVHGSCAYLGKQASLAVARRVLASEPGSIGSPTLATVLTVFRCRIADLKDAATVASRFFAHGAPTVPGVDQAVYPDASSQPALRLREFLHLALLRLAGVVALGTILARTMDRRRRTSVSSAD